MIPETAHVVCLRRRICARGQTYPGSLQWLSVCIALLLVLTNAVAAGTIQMVIATRFSVLTSGIQAEIEIRNRGDEAAFNITPKVEFHGIEAAGSVTDVLDPSRSHTDIVTLTVPNLERSHGAWPVTVRVAYRDARHHPFEALHVATVQVGPVRYTTPFGLELPGIRLNESGRMRARIDWPTGAASEVRVTFAVPVGLELTPRTTTIPREQSGLTASVRNTGATPGSRLPVFAVAEYDRREGHVALVASAQVEIVPAGAGLEIYRIIPISLIVLVVTWAIIAARSMWQRRSRNVS